MPKRNTPKSFRVVRAARNLNSKRVAIAHERTKDIEHQIKFTHPRHQRLSQLLALAS